MKKILLSVVIYSMLILSACASELKNIEYKNIKQNSKIYYNPEFDKWSDRRDKNSMVFVKQITSGTGNYSEFYTPEGDFAFTSGCTYEFIYKGNLIGYSNQDLKFYEITFINNEPERRELCENEVRELFPEYRLIRISDFSSGTNSLKIKKDSLNFKLILLNDTDINFYHYSFTSGNAKFDKYTLNGFIDIKRKGMIHFSHFGENTDIFPWYVLLVR